MCGRFTLTASSEAVAGTFGVADPPPLRSRYNVAPTQVVAVVGLNPSGERRVGMLSWGQVRSWAADPGHGPRAINAKGETVHQKPMFRDLFRTRRCLVPADGFFEWRAVGRTKRPHHIRLRGGGLMAFAGLWDVWTGGDGRKIASCSILTTEANPLVSAVHDRMPVIVPPDAYDVWLDTRTPVADLRALLRPYPAEGMKVVPVGAAVNSPRNDGPECLTSAA